MVQIPRLKIKPRVSILRPKAVDDIHQVGINNKNAASAGMQIPRLKLWMASLRPKAVDFLLVEVRLNPCERSECLGKGVSSNP